MVHTTLVAVDVDVFDAVRVAAVVGVVVDIAAGVDAAELGV